MAAYGAYFIWWYASAYGFGNEYPEQYSYILGMPEWFFYSCIVGYPLIAVGLWAVVRFFFKEMDLNVPEGAPVGDIGSSSVVTERGMGKEEVPHE